MASSGKRHKVRMMVLEVDAVLETTKARRGTFGDIFHELFTTAAAEHDPPLEVETLIRFVVEPEGGMIPDLQELEQHDIHAVVFSGSKYDAHSNDAWILRLVRWIQDAWTTHPDIRFSGVCFGHQILCRALGSVVQRSPGEDWEFAHTKIDLTPIGQELFRTSDPYIYLHQMHQDQVLDAPAPGMSKFALVDHRAHVWGSTHMCPIQGVYLRERLFTSQGHLGYDPQMVREHIEMRIAKGIVKDTKAAEEAKETAELYHDGRIVAGAILRFFNGDDVDVRDRET